MVRVRRAAAKRIIVLAGLTPWMAPPAQAHHAQAASAYYRDGERVSSINSADATYETQNWFPGDGRLSSLKVGATETYTFFRNPRAVVVTKDLAGDPRLVDRAGTVSYDQGIAVGSIVGTYAGIDSSAVATSRWVGVRMSQWWRQDTLQTNLDVRRTLTSEQSPLLAPDIDGQHVVLPSELSGVNVNLELTHLTTPSTILRGAFSYTRRSDRPDASGVSGEVRQFSDSLDGAIYASISHYENVGQILPVTTYGSVVANSAQVEWHQHLPWRLIGILTYRSYLEDEKPRAADAPRKRLGSDWLAASLHWRLGDGLWVADTSELYGFAGQYVTNEPRQGVLVGIGASWAF